MCECTMSRVQTTEGLSSTSELTTHDPWTFQFIVQVWIMLSFLWKPYVMCFCLMAGTHKVFMIESWWITNCQQFLCLQWVPPHAFALYLFKLISGFQPSPTNHGACKWGQRSLAPAGIPATPCFSSFSLRNVTGPRKQETKKNIASKEMLRIPTHLLELRMARKKFPFAKRKRNTNHSTSFFFDSPSPETLNIWQKKYIKKTFPILHYHSPNSKHQLPMISFHQVLSMRNPRLAATRVVALPLEADGPTSDLKKTTVTTGEIQNSLGSGSEEPGKTNKTQLNS